jgi:predicted small lipoprotein YifL
MNPRRLISLVAVVAVSGSLTGCGISDPYQKPSTPSITTTATAAGTRSATSAADARDPAPERGGTIPTADQRAEDHIVAGARARTARAAVLRYARLYIDWTAAALAGDQRRLARLSVGAARLTAQQQAATTGTDRTLRADHLANHGMVVSAAPGAGVERGRWVIVTREQTTGTGSYHDLPYQLHVTLATAIHTRRGWVISQWSPQV